MKYGIELSEECAVEIDTWPGAPAPSRVEFEFTVLAGELEETLEQMGGRERFHLLGAHVYSRHHVPVTCNGERVGDARVKVWVLDDPKPSASASASARREVFACAR